MTLPFLEPALEELLREVAADPRSSLLRVDRPSLLKGPFDHDPMVRESCTGLRNAERELLRVYRQELGHALRECCFDIVYNREDKDLHLFADHGTEKFPQQREYRDASHASRRLSELHGGRKIKRLVIEATQSCSPLGLAVLACRISPNTNSYLSLSDAYEYSDLPQLERRAIQRAAALVTTRIQHAHVLSYSGFTQSIDNRLEAAMASYRGAISNGALWPNEVLSWLCMAIQCQSESDFLSADELLKQPCFSDLSVRLWTEDQLTRRAYGHWSIREGAGAFTKSHVGRVSERTSHVVQTLFLS